MSAILSSPQIVALLQRLPLFAGVDDDHLCTLADACRIDRVGPNGIVFRQGDACDRIWIVYEGRVKIVRRDESGRETILEIIQPGEVFGGGVIFLPEQPAEAQAVAEADVVSFAHRDYVQFLLEHPLVALKVIRQMGARLHAAIEMNALAGERVDRRLAHILLKLATRCGRPDPEGVVITVSLSRQDLADMSGTTLETAIRIVSRFRAEGLLKTRRGGYLVILDTQRLMQLAQG